MHEVSIVHDIIETIKESSKLNNINKVNKVFMKIGEFTCIDENSINFAFDVLSKNTLCEGALLDIERIKGKAKCNVCNDEFFISFTNKLCPKCRCYSSNIINGYEILVYEIDVD